MTTDQKKVLADFEFKLRQLMDLCNKFNLANQTLTVQLTEKERALQTALNEMDALKTKYDNLKIARIISVKQDDLTGAKQRLSKLVREVDKCISLLND